MFTSMGSPKGATFRTVTRVPGVSPMSTSRRFTGPLSLPTFRMTPLWPGSRSIRVPPVFTVSAAISRSPPLSLNGSSFGLELAASNFFRPLYYYTPQGMASPNIAP